MPERVSTRAMATSPVWVLLTDRSACPATVSTTEGIRPARTSPSGRSSSHRSTPGVEDSTFQSYREHK
jgi:hypothetical protein